MIKLKNKAKRCADKSADKSYFQRLKNELKASIRQAYCEVHYESWTPCIFLSIPTIKVLLNDTQYFLAVHDIVCIISCMYVHTVRINNVHVYMYVNRLYVCIEQPLKMMMKISHIFEILY